MITLTPLPGKFSMHDSVQVRNVSTALDKSTMSSKKGTGDAFLLKRMSVKSQSNNRQIRDQLENFVASDQLRNSDEDPHIK